MSIILKFALMTYSKRKLTYMLEELLATINKCLASSTDQTELHWVNCCAFTRAFQSDSGINSNTLFCCM